MFFVFIDIKQIDKNNINTVEAVYNGHPRDLRNWPLKTGSLKRLTGRGLMSILMAYHTKNTSCKETIGQSTLFQEINTINKVQCQPVTV